MALTLDAQLFCQHGGNREQRDHETLHWSAKGTGGTQVGGSSHDTPAWPPGLKPSGLRRVFSVKDDDAWWDDDDEERIDW